MLPGNDLGEVGDAGKVLKHEGNQGQPVAAKMSLRRHHHHLVKEGIDGRAKTYLLNNFLVDGEIITEAGSAAIIAYEAVHGRTKISAPVVKKGLTDDQFEALRIATKQPYRWDSLPDRTRKSLLRREWVVEENDLPKVTSEGLRVYQENLTA